MPTAASIITQAWVDLGVGSPGETPSPSESANGLAKLNAMLDSWSGARDLVYEISDLTFALTSAQSFLIGPTAGAPFNVPRPLKVENAQILITVGAKVLSFDLKIVSQTEWQSIDDKGATGTVPTVLYVDPQVPNAVLNFHPIPLAVATTQVDLGVWAVVGQFTLLTTNANFPPAYLRAITIGLQLEIAPTYGQVNPAILQERARQFSEAIAVVRSLNALVQLTPLSPVNAQTQQQPDIAGLLAQLQGQR